MKKFFCILLTLAVLTPVSVFANPPIQIDLGKDRGKVDCIGINFETGEITFRSETRSEYGTISRTLYRGKFSDSVQIDPKSPAGHFALKTWDKIGVEHWGVVYDPIIVSSTLDDSPVAFTSGAEKRKFEKYIEFDFSPESLDKVEWAHNGVKYIYSQ
ncbi:hypothetical protein ACFL2B_01905 [Patescibacteria group bacterium]